MKMYNTNPNFNFNSLKQTMHYSNDNNNIKNYKTKILKLNKVIIKPNFGYDYLNLKINNTYDTTDRQGSLYRKNMNNDFGFNNNDLMTYNSNMQNYKNYIVNNGKIRSLGNLSYNQKIKPEMNIMINNGIIKNVYLNKNKKNNNYFYNNTAVQQNHTSNFYKSINQIKNKIYNDYNLTLNNINNNTTPNKFKIYKYQNLNDKNRITKNNKINKIKQIPTGKNDYFNIYRTKNKNKNQQSKRINSYCNNNNINNNIYDINIKKSNGLYNCNNFYSKTNIYENRNNNIRNNYAIPIPRYNNNIVDHHHSVNNIISSINNNKDLTKYLNTENNDIKNINNNPLISSSDSNSSNELSALADDIIKYRFLYYRDKKPLIKNISYNLKKNFNKEKINNNIINNKAKENKIINKKDESNNNKNNNNNEDKSTDENFDLIDQIINQAELEDKNRKNLHIKFDLEKNKYIDYNLKEIISKNSSKKMEFYLALLHSKTKINSILKNFDKKDIKINKNYMLNENMEEFEILGDLYNIFYLKDINDLDKNLKKDINDINSILIKNKKY